MRRVRRVCRGPSHGCRPPHLLRGRSGKVRPGCVVPVLAAEKYGRCQRSRCSVPTPELPQEIANHVANGQVEDPGVRLAGEVQRRKMHDRRPRADERLRRRGKGSWEKHCRCATCWPGCEREGVKLGGRPVSSPERAVAKATGSSWSRPCPCGSSASGSRAGPSSGAEPRCSDEGMRWARSRLMLGVFCEVELGGWEIQVLFSLARDCNTEASRQCVKANQVTSAVLVCLTHPSRDDGEITLPSQPEHTAQHMMRNFSRNATHMPQQMTRPDNPTAVTHTAQQKNSTRPQFRSYFLLPSRSEPPPTLPPSSSPQGAGSTAPARPHSGG